MAKLKALTGVRAMFLGVKYFFVQFAFGFGDFIY